MDFSRFPLEWTDSKKAHKKYHPKATVRLPNISGGGCTYPLVNVYIYITMERSTMLIGKSTISTGPFSSSQTVWHNQRLILNEKCYGPLLLEVRPLRVRGNLNMSPILGLETWRCWTKTMVISDLPILWQKNDRISMHIPFSEWRNHELAVFPWKIAGDWADLVKLQCHLCAGPGARWASW